ncbi:MAG: hypothetical protein MAG451_00882 [Anaerolineales bacterium]|nr:hypothetical protein [Anaerolineales bacterium]
MSSIIELLHVSELKPPFSREEANDLETQLGRLSDLTIYPRSITAARRSLFFLGRRDPSKGAVLSLSKGSGRGTEKWLGIVSYEALPAFAGSEEFVEFEEEDLVLQVCPTSHANAEALRDALPFTAPTVLGLEKSFGFGDRLGLATPGHVRAARKHDMLPIFAQQSIREMTRTDRTPEEVMDDATWGVFEEGWRGGFGADADHLMTTDDIDVCVEAGFTFYTIDPSEYVDNAADADEPATLEKKVEDLPWRALDAAPAKLRDLYQDQTFDLGDFSLTFDEESLLRAAAKYSRAVAHTAVMYRHLAERMGAEPFELEMSVDETETPTTVLEHFFVASELRRLGVEWVSLAPRYVGRFEKGVDYIGDPSTSSGEALEEFEESFAQHVAIAEHLGPYKLSLHSGSDKFSLYPAFSRQAGDLVHVKTAGTSYLEALRAIAGIDPELFREILAFGLDRYETDKATYHVSAEPGKVPTPAELADEELTSVLDQFDGRQVLHVTFGSVLTMRDGAGGYRFRDRLLGALEADEEAYYDVLEKHFERHLAPFDEER